MAVPTLVLTPNAGAPTTTITISGTGWTNPGDNGLCTSLVSVPVGAISSFSCTIASGTLSGSFVVDPAAVLGSSYSITATGISADSAVAVLRIPIITLLPITGPPGTVVIITGGSFATGDNSCTITGTAGLVTSPSCAMTSGSITAATFTVGNVPVGPGYSITVRGAAGGPDFATGTFSVTAGPTITLTPAIGPIGAFVNVTGTGFLTTDNTCSITGTPVSLAACTIALGTGIVKGNFTVKNVAPGPYVITATGTKGGVTDSAQATFTVIGASITLTPASGQIGTIVNATGSGFSFSDVTCTITSPSLSSLVVNPACRINGGTGTPRGNFTVGNVAPGSYVIRVTGNTGDFAEATFHVTSGPSITLTPNFGQIGAFINMAGTGFLPSDKTCTITGTGSSVLNPACSIVQGSGAPKGNFTIGNVAPGSYLITVTGNGGDSAQAVLTVTRATGTLTLNPTNATTGTTVAFRGTGFQPTDTGCVVQSANDNTPPNSPGSNNLLITSATCTMSGQVATGTFVVGPLATTNIPWNVTVKGTPANDIPTGVWALFNVTAQISLTPTQANNGTVVQVTGTGFSSAAATCALTIAPTSTGFIDIVCGVSGSTGHVAASFKVNGAAVGLYVVSVTGSGPGGGLAGANFQVGMPSANVTLSPNSLFAPPGGSVGISGSGFNPSDISCTITPSLPLVFTVNSCSASSGFVSGSITVLNNAPPGLYQIVVTGNKGDFAFNYLGVNAVTTQTTTSFTTTSSTSATTTTLQTTTTAVSTSLSTSTLQTTGFSTWIFTSKTATTMFGQTTTLAVSTSTTTSFVSFLTSTTSTLTTTITHTLGQIIQKQMSLRYEGVDFIGLIGVLSLALPLLFRRYVD
jgi:hypothetical protein